MEASDNNIKLPLYVQISELLTREINAGLWPVGSRLPTEADLAAKLNCAVGTLRKALAELEANGFLERIQGSGTYVRQNEDAKSVYGLFHLELNDGVGLPSAEVLELSKLDRPRHVAAFGDGTSVSAYRIRRLRTLGDTPAALEEIWFDARHIEKLQTPEISESLYQFYRDRLRFWVSNVEDRVSVDAFPDWAPAKSGFLPGESCGFVTRVSRSNQGTIEEYSRTWFDTEKVHYNARWH